MAVALAWLFFGIAIVADIFMEAIEVITSKTTSKEVWDKDKKNKYYVDVPVWNATIANLTLMALGSSAPEILLNLLQTIGTRGEPASELGPFTIVGSAAFNLLVISACSIIAVDEVKAIADLGVFFTTAVFSIFAYFWLLVILTMSTPEVVTIEEAWLTFIFFLVLVIIAFGADKYNQRRVDALKTEDDRKREAAE